MKAPEPTRKSHAITRAGLKSPRIGERSFPNRCTTLFKNAKNDPRKKQVDMSQVRSVVVIISTDHARWKNNFEVAETSLLDVRRK